MRKQSRISCDANIMSRQAIALDPVVSTTVLEICEDNKDSEGEIGRDG